MKKMLIRVLCAMMVMMVLCGNAAVALAGSSYRGYGIVCNLDWDKHLNIRSGPSTNSCILGQLTNGNRVDVYGKNGDWYHIQYGSINGYVSADYLRYYNSPSSCATTTPTYYYTSYVYATCGESKLSTRTGPGTNYDGDGVTKDYSGTYGDTFKVISASRNNGIWWVQIEVERNGKLRRCYTGSWRFYNLDVNDLTIEGVYACWAKVTSGLYPYEGPGTRYTQSGDWLSKGTTGRIITIENGYAQFEYTYWGYSYRCWVPTSYLCY